jgi:hypothetical protein
MKALTPTYPNAVLAIGTAPLTMFLHNVSPMVARR